MMDLMDVSTEIQESLGRSYSVPDDIDEEDLMGGELFCYLLLPLFQIYSLTFTLVLFQKTIIST